MMTASSKSTNQRSNLVTYNLLIKDPRGYFRNAKLSKNSILPSILTTINLSLIYAKGCTLSLCEGVQPSVTLPDEVACSTKNACNWDKTRHGVY